LRNDARADLVAMITGDDPMGAAGGMAYMNSHESVTSHTQLPYFAFTHEIGHNFGAGHNRESTRFPHPYGHGLRVAGVLRTVMAYRCKPNNCPVIPYFSKIVL